MCACTCAAHRASQKEGERERHTEVHALTRALGRASDSGHGEHRTERHVCWTPYVCVCVCVCHVYRSLHSERQELIKQWDQALEAMRHRDASIVVASEQVRPVTHTHTHTSVLLLCPALICEPDTGESPVCMLCKAN